MYFAETSSKVDKIREMLPNAAERVKAREAFFQLFSAEPGNARKGRVADGELRQHGRALARRGQRRDAQRRPELGSSCEILTLDVEEGGM